MANPNHDEKGQFAEGPGGGGRADKSRAKAIVERNYRNGMNKAAMGRELKARAAEREKSGETVEQMQAREKTVEAAAASAKADKSNDREDHLMARNLNQNAAALQRRAGNEEQAKDHDVSAQHHDEHIRWYR